jgi:hypothetical protein
MWTYERGRNRSGRKLHTEEFHIIYSSPNIKIRQMEHAACWGDLGIVSRIKLKLIIKK